MFIPLHDTNPIRHVKFPYVTYGLMAVTALVFLWQSLLPPAAFEDAAIALGMIPIVVRDLYPQPLPWLPDWATLVTYAFLHADWLHMLTNMLFLWIFGDNIEDAMGHVRFLVFYLACAVFAALAFLAFNLDGNGPLVGASGAVAGVMGAYVLLYPHARVFVLARIVIPIPPAAARLLDARRLDRHAGLLPRRRPGQPGGLAGASWRVPCRRHPRRRHEAPPSGAARWALAVTAGKAAHRRKGSFTPAS